MTVASDDIEHYLEVAKRLFPKVAAASEQIHNDRELPPALAQELADEGFFRLLLPKSLGGAELNFLDFLRIIQYIGQADSSTAWCLNQNNILATNAVRMPEATAKKIWNEQRAVLTNGPPTYEAKAVQVDGGYKLSGRWDFSTGIRHATWVAALAPVTRDSHEQDSITSRRDSRIFLVPKEEVEVHDAWDVRGLRGTGSFSFSALDIFVPSDHTYSTSDPTREPGPTYAIPTVLTFGAGFATAALGNARASLDAVIKLASTKTPAYGNTLLRDMSTTQRQMGQTEAMWRSCRAYLREATARVWESASVRGTLTVEERIDLRLAATHAIRTSCEVVGIAYNLGGSSAVFESSPLQRYFQDANVMSQQGQGRMLHFDVAGAYHLGLEPEGLF
ncbi:MAG: hypothetical protein BZY79_02385 [SAR202 cluster bacterium Casp-Chloro-G4]|nr:acyl-CoA dehydrogenase family protein [Chloroflexota bacterium]MDA1228017.1 acyl-CoA dehydrogenase family protein [Chloroflexota bacterium]PKB61679.1 MAG: hypothetical protein BZY79_02385 [SAR202 cluster bacterium Casp-Chloro-G4]